MRVPSSPSLLKALCIGLSFSTVAALPAAPVFNSDTSALSPRQQGEFWLSSANLHGQISPVYGQTDNNYKIFRNVKDYGAVGDGRADDTEAINRAMTDGTRCGQGCNSTTISPAIVYFPSGNYVISKPIIEYYYTQMVGDYNDPPTITASSNFKGIALIDADPYDDTGANWYINQNNFFRTIRNFIIDVSQVDGGQNGAGIHWQVAQASSLQNINFKMSTSGNTKQQGIFMDNGSGGFMSDLTFEGGLYGMFLGNQQFTTRNLQFKNCKTAIFMNWNWGWTFHNVTIVGQGSNSSGIDMANAPDNQTVGSISLLDSSISNVEVGINSAFSQDSIPVGGGTIVLRNVDMSQNVGTAVRSNTGNQMLAAGKIASWVAGNGYNGSAKGSRTIGDIPPSPAMPSSLLTSDGKIFGRSRPQYADYPASSFISAKSLGAKGDGKTDDTKAVQALLTQVANTNNIAYFDHGAYRITDTVTVPPNVKIVGEIWPLILADGFKDVNNPKPVFKIGNPGDKGAFEMTDMVFEVLGPQPGAVMIEYNLQSEQGQSGMWDSHVRLGGTYNSRLQLQQCAKNPASTEVKAECQVAFMLFHATRSSSNLYLENQWMWVADHDWEDPLNRQISIYNARGVLIQSQGPVWLWGTASEHSVMYNYQFDGVKALFSGFTQTETPYFQPNPSVPQPFQFNTSFPWNDPTFTVCTSNNPAVPCKDAWGMRVVGSSGVWMYSIGMYSFFNNYDQKCVAENNCQENMIRIQNSEVNLFAVSTKAAVNMIYDDNKGQVKKILDADNRSNFCATVGYYLSRPY